MPSTEKSECAGYLALRQEFPAENEAIHRAVCYGDAGREIEGRSYCVLHAPTDDKVDDFLIAIESRRDAKQYDFRHVWFPFNTDFRKHKFENPADFSSAHFNGEANFGRVVFDHEANFRSTTFAGETGFFAGRFKGNVSFEGAQFQKRVVFGETQFDGELSLISARFNGAVDFHLANFAGDFRCADAHFSDIAHFGLAAVGRGLDMGNAVFEKPLYFNQATFKADALVSFGQACFKDAIEFTWNVFEKGAELYFGEATYEKPARVRFVSSELQPRWFINSDTRQFNFEDVKFPLLSQNHAVELELATASRTLNRMITLRTGKTLLEIPVERDVLGICYRRLADNAEANNRYDQASDLRYSAMETRRLSNRGGWAFWTVHWWYWFSSGYGEQSLRALTVLLGLWVLFAALYLLPFANFYRWETKVSSAQDYQAVVNENKADQAGRRLGATEAFAYSFGVMSLQKPEPKPLGNFPYILVALESVLGPLQTGLLLLAIRRKFMR